MEQRKKDTTAGLRAFIREISELYELEKREEKTAHFSNSNFNPEELTEVDQLVWEKIKNGSFTRDDLRTYRADILDLQTKRPKQGVPSSRDTFLSFIENKAVGILMKQDEEKK